MNIVPIRTVRTSALRDAQQGTARRWSTVDDMEVAAAYDDSEAARLVEAGLGDLGFRRRVGVKGRGARAWLQALGVATPEHPNHWLRLPCGSVVARLGDNEFVVASAGDGRVVESITAAAPAHGVYPVPRFDADLLLAGRRASELLAQTCAFHFGALDAAAQPLVMTSMVGVAVTVLALPGLDGTSYRLWCDGTYGGYLWRTLAAIAVELGGGPVGLESLESLGSLVR